MSMNNTYYYGKRLLFETGFCLFNDMITLGITAGNYYHRYGIKNLINSINVGG